MLNFIRLQIRASRSFKGQSGQIIMFLSNFINYLAALTFHDETFRRFLLKKFIYPSFFSMSELSLILWEPLDILQCNPRVLLIDHHQANGHHRWLTAFMVRLSPKSDLYRLRRLLWMSTKWTLSQIRSSKVDDRGMMMESSVLKA